MNTFSQVFIEHLLVHKVPLPSNTSALAQVRYLTQTVQAANRIEAALPRHELPTLIGSQQQIRWAKQVRDRVLHKLVGILVKASLSTQTIIRLSLPLTAFFSETGAAVWIARRQFNTDEIAQLFHASLGKARRRQR